MRSLHGVERRCGVAALSRWPPPIEHRSMSGIRPFSRPPYGPRRRRSARLREGRGSRGCVSDGGGNGDGAATVLGRLFRGLGRRTSRRGGGRRTAHVAGPWVITTAHGTSLGFGLSSHDGGAEVLFGLEVDAMMKTPTASPSVLWALASFLVCFLAALTSAAKGTPRLEDAHARAHQ